jgi:Type II secretion system (T2SS), protein E, N-terminal domain
MRIRIGDLLVKAGVITDLQLKAALAEQSQWGGKLGDILVRMEFLTEEVLVRALSKQSGIPRADLSGEPNKGALARISAETAEEFNVVPVGVKEEGRTLVVAMSDPGNVMVTDHVRQIAGCKIEAHLAGASAIRNAIARWYRGAELNEEQSTGMKLMNNAGNTMATVDPRKKRAEAPVRPPSAPPPVAQQKNGGGDVRPSAVEVLRGVEETQRRSVAALKAMVELLIEKGVFSREEYLSRVKSR